MSGARPGTTGGVFAGIRCGFIRAEHDTDGHGSFAAVELSMSDRLLGISCQLCYKPAERFSGSLEGCSHDDGAAFNIPRAIDPGGSLMQPGRDRLPLSDHAESRSDDL